MRSWPACGPCWLVDSGRPGSTRTAGAGLRAVAFLLVAATLAGGCTGGAKTPEEQVRETIARGEKAVRAKDASALKDFISDGYRDGERRTKQEMNGLLRYYLRQHRSIHLLSRVQSVEFLSPTRARVQMVAALAAREMTAGALLGSIDADIYAFDLQFANEGRDVWRLTAAAWEPATLEDLTGE